MRRVQLASVALFGAIAGFSRESRAGDAVALEWNAPPSCPDRAYVVSAIDRIVGSRAASSSPVRASATVTASGDALHLELIVEHNDGSQTTRSLDAKDCTSLAESVAVVLAMIVDEQPPAEAPPALAPPKTIDERPAPVRVPPPSAPTPAVTLHAFVGPMLDSGTVPGQSIAASAGAGAKSPLLWAELAGGWSPRSSRTTAAGETYFAWWSVSARTGLRRGWFAAGVGVEIARLTARAPEVVHPLDASFTRVSPLAVATVTVPIASWVGLRLEASVLSPVRRPRWVIEGEAAAYTSAAFVWRAGIVGEVRF